MRCSALGAFRMSSTMLTEPLGNSCPITGVRVVDLKPSREPEEWSLGWGGTFDSTGTTVILSVGCNSELILLVNLERSSSLYTPVSPRRRLSAIALPTVHAILIDD